MRRWLSWGVVTILACGPVEHSVPQGEQRDHARIGALDAAAESERRPPPEVEWRDGPHRPSQMSTSAHPQVVLLSAQWCQWCRVFEHEVLPDPRVRGELAEFSTLHVDVDADPLWMDIPGFEGLPSLVFFDGEGRHVLTRSGHRPATELALLLETVRAKLSSGELEPYPAPPPALRLPDRALSPAEATQELGRLELAIYLKVNSNDGGFYTPARHPFPALLVELERWRVGGNPPARVEEVVDLTIEKALRGRSRRLDGDPASDMVFSAQELKRLSSLGPQAGRDWLAAIESLPDADPYLGLQDPVDRGVFRYAAGPGWYNAHFERRADENLAWVELLRARKKRKQAKEIQAFVDATFDHQGILATSQRADPFYYRLTARERQDVDPPPVALQFNLLVQARAARIDASRCAVLLRVPPQTWPRASWTREGREDPTAGEASVDAMGELLLALSQCRGSDFDVHAAQLAEVAIERWQSVGVPRNARAFRLAAGVCAVVPGQCSRALAATRGVELDLAHPPPLWELSLVADGLAQ